MIDVGTDIQMGVNIFDERFTGELDTYHDIISPWLDENGYTSTLQGHSLGSTVSLWLNHELRADPRISNVTTFNSGVSAIGNMMTEYFGDWKPGPPLNELEGNYMDRVANVVQKGDPISTDVLVPKSVQYGDIFEYNNVPERGGLGSHSLNTFDNPLWFEDWSKEYGDMAKMVDGVSEKVGESFDVKKNFDRYTEPIKKIRPRFEPENNRRDKKQKNQDYANNVFIPLDSNFNRPSFNNVFQPIYNESYNFDKNKSYNKVVSETETYNNYNNFSKSNQYLEEHEMKQTCPNGFVYDN